MRGHEIKEQQQFGMLTVLSYKGKNSHGDRVYECMCDCGNITTATASDLVKGNKKSCGCLHGERHGHADDRLYSVWCTMKARCDNPSNQKYKNYGGRGIKVCDEWRQSFSSFYEWSMKNGYDYDAPYGQCTLDRINVDGNYEPSNCRWTDAKTQARNKRHIKREVSGIELDYKGRHYSSIQALARDYNINTARLERRIHRMPVDEAMREIKASIVAEDGNLKSIRYVSKEQWSQILMLEERGVSRREIGEQLKISKRTVIQVIERNRRGFGPYNNPLPTKLIGGTSSIMGVRL